MLLPLWFEFFNDLQYVRGRTLNTIQAYRHDLELFISYKKENKDVLGFYEYMRTHKLSTRSQARVISSLRTYFKFCENQGIQSPELLELRPPKVKSSLPKSLTLDEFKKVFQACAISGDPTRTARNQITLMMLYGLGCRVTELINLNTSDFSEFNQSLKIMGKGNKERFVPLTEQLQLSLVHYLSEFRPLLLKENHIDSLLINDRGHRPSRVDVWRWLAAWSHKAALGEVLGPHRFRHACANTMLESGADLRSIQKLLGHASIQTTQVYSEINHQQILNQNLRIQSESEEDFPTLSSPTPVTSTQSPSIAPLLAPVTATSPPPAVPPPMKDSEVF